MSKHHLSEPASLAILLATLTLSSVVSFSSALKQDGRVVESAAVRNAGMEQSRLAAADAPRIAAWNPTDAGGSEIGRQPRSP